MFLYDSNRYAAFVCLRKLLPSIGQPSYPEGEGDCGSEVHAVYLSKDVVTGF